MKWTRLPLNGFPCNPLDLCTHERVLSAIASEPNLCTPQDALTQAFASNVTAYPGGQQWWLQIQLFGLFNFEITTRWVGVHFSGNQPAGCADPAQPRTWHQAPGRNCRTWSSSRRATRSSPSQASPNLAPPARPEGSNPFTETVQTVYYCWHSR